MFKETNNSSNWGMFDSKRKGYNQENDYVYANSSADENNIVKIDMLSNGFKIKERSSGGVDSDNNTTGGIYIYLAFAESPFKYSNAR